MSVASGMSWQDDPATEKQLNYLKKFGYTPDGPLTKGAASDLITQFEDDPERQKILLEEDIKYSEEWAAYLLHKEVLSAQACLKDCDPEDKQQMDADKSDVQLAMDARIDFWLATFNPMRSDDDCILIYDLFEAHGEHYLDPKREEVQHILDALDAALPTWDKDHTELFYQTLELNFPQLRK
jgi:hypothetical protein